KEIKNKGLKITRAKGGLSIIDTDDLKFTIIAPNSEKYDETNEYSIVNKLIYKNTSFIFTGDAEKDSEEEMIKLGYDLKADVLKVGHHGGRTSTNYEFLERVNPKFAVISVGKDNDYGHPHKEVLKRLDKMGIKVFRTDELGTIIATSDGVNIKFNKEPCKVDLKSNDDSTKSSVNSVNTNNDSKTTETNTANTNVTKTNASVIIKNIDLSKEIVTIQNTTDKDINMTGWKLVSEEGNQIFNFPDGYILKAGATITIASGKSTGDLKWTKKYIWNNDGDTGILYNDKGEEVSRY
ncbi:lamin tail domain-containing protein, partial [Caloranaerobacter sp. DY30410]|uniref:lamin tail domain-containing protein n=1 Tax=Caloranaerobacter sp. DY30410 TaxID=3238305 RepID=UPI003D084BC3